MSSEDLPVILVAAKDTSAARKIISDLIEKDVSNDTDADSVWEISNKYYKVRVRLQALPDGELAAKVDRVEAHVIYLDEDECSVECVEGRAVRLQSAGGKGEVQLVLADCTSTALPKELEAAALRLNYELLSLREVTCSPPPSGPFPSLRGVRRAREALHAHTWPGMQLTALVSPFAGWASNGVALEDDSGSRSSSEAGGDGGDVGDVGDGDSEPELEPAEAECVRRAELFADALCAIQGVRAATGGGAGGGDGRDEERLLRAEQLVAAFCRALGSDLDAL